MSDLKLIIQLEKEIGRELEERDFEKIMEYGQKGFVIDKNGNVIGLNLCEMKLDTVKIYLSKFRHLKKLRLSNTNLRNISFLQGLSNLTTVDLWNNKITDISVLQGLNNLTSLNLMNNQIKDISFLQELHNLNTLDLGNNQITDISFLQGLSNLTTLNLINNQITDISVLQRLSNLTTLSLSNNKITDISPLTGLTNLKYLDLCYNRIGELPEEVLNLELDINVDSSFVLLGQIGIFLFDNPIEKPPLEIIEKGREAIKEYFESLKKEKALPLNEMKVLLVGDGGAGKTSLVKGLLGQEFDINETKTHGINIDAWTVKEAEKGIKVNIWDFGGQEIMHATHQFFLSKRSLYILVLDGRKDEKTEYWLKHIESFGGESPLLWLRPIMRPGGCISM